MSSKKNLEIEYLRAVAIGMTMLSDLPSLLPEHHQLFFSLFTVFMPWTGVDLFFCISGYVVCRAYLNIFDEQREQGRFWIAAKAFWIRRIYRLLPTAWLWVLIPLVLSIAFNSSGIFGSWYANLRSITAVVTFSGNIANQFGAILGPNSVYWSLALEEQFYFIFPLFLLFLPSTKWRVASLFALIALQFGFDRNMLGDASAAFASSIRLDAMMWGVLICIFSRSEMYRQFEPTLLKGSSLPALVVTLLLIYLLGAIAGQMVALPIAVGLIAIVSAILVFLASFNAGYIYCPSWLSGVLQWLGARSYGIYVIHFPAYRLSHEIWSRHAAANGVGVDTGYTLQLVVTAFVLIAVLSEANYRFVEVPLRRKGAHIAAGIMNGQGRYHQASNLEAKQA